MTTPSFSISPFNVERDISAVTALWHSLLAQYPVPEAVLSRILGHQDDISGLPGTHFILKLDNSPNPIGFLASFVLPPSAKTATARGLISVLLIDSAHQHHGLGSALLNHAIAELKRSPHSCESFEIGSYIPRIFAGMPTDISPAARSFFSHRGFEAGGSSRDYYHDIQSFEPPSAVMEKAAKHGVTFASLTKAGEEECLSGQRANFTDPAWLMGYEKLCELGMHDQIMVAYDGEGDERKQIGWTFMLDPGAPFLSNMALPCLCGPKTGLIAAVGTDKAARGKGVGIAMVAAAMADMKRRGIEGVFIDWVVLEGFYEKLGFEVWQEYRAMEWKGD